MPTHKTIAASLIVKNDSEELELRRALNSIKDHVDKIFLTGTKEPQDKIKQVARDFNAEYNFFPWIKDFSAARNFAMQQIPKEYEWYFWMDCDDVVVGAEKFQEAIALAEANNIKAVFARYLYQVELDEKGNVKQILIEHLRERLLKNDDTFKWVAPIHETLIENVPAGKTDYNGFLLVHLINPDEMISSMYRNIEILEEEVIRNPEDPRPIYYLAKAYFDTKISEILYESIGEGLDSLTLELMKDYIKKSGWQEERAQCWEYISMLHREMGQLDKAIQALLEGLYEFPRQISIYIQLAICYVTLKDWANALHYVKLAGQMEIPKTTLVVNPKDYKSMIAEVLYHVYLNTGQLEMCQKVVNELNVLIPSDMNKQRKADVDDLKHRNDLAHWVVKLAHHLKETKQAEELKALIHSIPREIAGEPALIDLRNNYMPPRTWGSDEVCIYCGPGFEQWSPKSVGRGIGGSEEAVINMSRELTKKGWRVTVYADPMDDQGFIDGVNWLPYYHFNLKDRFNIFVVWRQIGALDFPINASKMYLWNHDIINPLTCTPERVAKIDKLMVLSKWHRENIPNVPDDKIMLTANGINL